MAKEKAYYKNHSYHHCGGSFHGHGDRRGTQGRH